MVSLTRDTACVVMQVMQRVQGHVMWFVRHRYDACSEVHHVPLFGMHHCAPCIVQRVMHCLLSLFIDSTWHALSLWAMRCNALCNVHALMCAVHCDELYTVPFLVLCTGHVTVSMTNRKPSPLLLASALISGSDIIPGKPFPLWLGSALINCS